MSPKKGNISIGNTWKYIFQSLIFRGHVSFLDLEVFFNSFWTQQICKSTPLTCFPQPNGFRWGAATRVGSPGIWPIKRQGFTVSPPENATAGTWKMMGFLSKFRICLSLEGGGSTKFQAETYPIVKPPTYMGKPTF